MTSMKVPAVTPLLLKFTFSCRSTCQCCISTISNKKSTHVLQEKQVSFYQHTKKWKLSAIDSFNMKIIRILIFPLIASASNRAYDPNEILFFMHDSEGQICYRKSIKVRCIQEFESYYTNKARCKPLRMRRFNDELKDFLRKAYLELGEL